MYRRETEGLKFLVAQNDELGRHAAGVDLLTRSALRWTEPSIASYVALTQMPLNIADAYDLPKSKPYAFNRRFDIMTGFRTVSMLVVPLHSPILGVLQLINATNEHDVVIPFTEDAERAVEDVTARTLESLAGAEYRDHPERSLLAASRRHEAWGKLKPQP